MLLLLGRRARSKFYFTVQYKSIFENCEQNAQNLLSVFFVPKPYKFDNHF